jgi:hypothetical protein
VFSDTGAIPGALMTSLEKDRKRILKAFSWKSPRTKLPVFFFGDSEGYGCFFTRHSFGADEYEYALAHGCGAFLAIQGEDHERSRLVHELAHAVLHRTHGTFGGAWLQEGFATYSEMLCLGRDVRAEFLAMLEKGHPRSLKGLILLRWRDFAKAARGRKSSSDFHLLAAAFFAFLKEGPGKERFDEMIESFAGHLINEGFVVQCLEALYGEPLDEIEKQFYRWTREKK